jgi:GDP-mannose transporter
MVGGVQGYFWMLSNCLCTAGYVLYMKHATKTIKISKFGMVLYNNLLSIPILLTGALCRGEFRIFLSEPSFHTSGYLLLSLYAGLVGFFLNIATLWCVSNNSATTYAVVGALNKIPTVIIGCVAWRHAPNVLQARGRPCRLSLPLSDVRSCGSASGSWLLFKAPMTSNTITFICVSMVGGFMYTASKLQEAKQAQADKLPK